jgi:putative NADH-flavin reductase
MKGISDTSWTFVSPSSNFRPGERTGKFRVGGDTLLMDAQGRSSISMEDFAVAILDEIENPKYVNKRFTAGY